MVRPVSDETALMKLSDLPAESLRPEFRAQVEALRKRVFAGARPKSLYGKPLNGAMLGSLAEAYCAALNSGSTPTISTAWDRVVDSQCGEAVEGAVRAYTEGMHARLAAAAAASGGSGGEPRPYAEDTTVVEEDAMLDAHAACSALAERHFAERAVQDSDKSPAYAADMKARLGIAFVRLRRANETASAAFCAALLDRLAGEASARLLQLRAAAPPTAAAPASSPAAAAAAAPAQARSTSNRRSVRSAQPVASRRVAGPSKATAFTMCGCGSAAACAPVTASHSRAVKSALPVAARRAQGDSAAAHTAPLWP